MSANQPVGMAARLTRVAPALAVLGAIWFAVMSALTSFVYAPTGVSPRDIGLSSGPILAQAAVGLATSFVIVALAVAVVGLIWGWRTSRKDSDEYAATLTSPPESTPENAVGAEPVATLAEAEALVQGEAFQNRIQTELLKFQMRWVSAAMMAVLVLCLWMIVAFFILVTTAISDRSAISAGKRPSFLLEFLGFPGPWIARVATVDPTASSTTPSVPRCALYLGQADGTVVLRTHNTTFRLPASSVQLALDDRNQCP